MAQLKDGRHVDLNKLQALRRCAPRYVEDHEQESQKHDWNTWLNGWHRGQKVAWTTVAKMLDQALEGIDE